MPEYLYPGVYIEEIERGPRPIEGVPTSTAAFLGETERGPIKPMLCTSYNDYKRLFGSVFGNRDRYMPYAVNGFFENGGRRAYVCRIAGQDWVTASLAVGAFTLNAIGPGTWANRVWVSVGDGTTLDKDKKPIGFRIKAAYWDKEPNGFEPFDPFLAENRAKLPRPALAEDFDDLSVTPESPNYYPKRLDGNSALIKLLKNVGAAADAAPDPNPGARLAGGTEPSAVGTDDFVGETAGVRDVAQGLDALKQDEFREVALVHAPWPAQDQVDIAVKIIAHCEDRKFRFAVLESSNGVGNANTLDPRTTIADTSYAAFYYPWLTVSDPQSGARKLVPPGGYALGVYARTDAERGVYKAPANEVVRGALDLEYDIDDNKQAVLNPRGVDVVRRFPGRGIRIWGARTLSSNALWKYVSVRRLFIFLENSIYLGTQWVVFEPNDDKLWARVKDTIRLFLRTQWREGALFGRTEDDAFFITCDRSIMTQDDILNGRLICEIGIAPVRPAEFVIFRIFQHTTEAQR